MTALVHVPPHLLPQTLDATRGLLARILDTNPGWMDERAARERLLSGSFQLHLALDERNNALAAMVTELVEAPSGRKFCFITGIAGANRDLWMDHLDGMEAWARREGCHAIAVRNGRKGWLREEKLKPYRVSVAYTFERELT